MFKVADCTAGIIPHSRDRRINNFRTLTALCTDATSGLGFDCPHGVLERWRSTPLARELGSPETGGGNSVQWSIFRDACIANCHCVDINPDEYSNNEATDPRLAQSTTSDGVSGQEQQPQEAVTSAGSSSGSSVGSTSVEDYSADVFCDGDWYGFPAENDCLHALEELPGYAEWEHPDDDEPLTDFVGFGAQATGINPVIQTPLLKSHGEHSIVFPANRNTFLDEMPRNVHHSYNALRGARNSRYCFGSGIHGGIGSGDLARHVCEPRRSRWNRYHPFLNVLAGDCG